LKKCSYTWYLSNVVKTISLDVNFETCSVNLKKLNLQSWIPPKAKKI